MPMKATRRWRRITRFLLLWGDLWPIMPTCWSVEPIGCTILGPTRQFFFPNCQTFAKQTATIALAYRPLPCHVDKLHKAKDLNGNKLSWSQKWKAQLIFKIAPDGFGTSYKQNIISKLYSISISFCKAVRTATGNILDQLPGKVHIFKDRHEHWNLAMPNPAKLPIVMLYVQHVVVKLMIQECFQLTSFIIGRDAHALEAVALHLTTAVELKKKRELFLQAHRSAFAAEHWLPQKLWRVLLKFL